MDLFSQAQEKVKRTLEEQKTGGVKELFNIVETIRHASQHLRDQQKDDLTYVTDRAADKMDRAIRYIELRDVNELLKDVQLLARSHPEAFWSGAFVIGLIAGRFFKSSNGHERGKSVSARKKERATVEPMSTTVWTESRNLESPLSRQVGDHE